MVALKLASAQALLGHDVRVLIYRNGTSGDDAGVLGVGLPGVERVQIHHASEEDWLERLTGRRAGQVASSVVSGECVFHLHGVWERMLLSVARVAQAKARGYVVTPHGMLDPWSLQQSWWKKKLALTAGVRAMLSEAMFLHFLNERERELAGPLGLTAPTEVIPNGIFESEVAALPPPGTFRRAFPVLGDRPYVLFLSRLHYKKGLDVLVDAFERVSGEFPSLMLVVAGPDGGAGEGFRGEVDRRGLRDRVVLTGPLYGELKMAAYAEAAAFCLPSRQEGFSMAILEALGVGVPCVVTQACNFPEVETSGAGVSTPLCAKAFADGMRAVLRDALASPAARAAIGQRGRSLVLSKYTWPRVAEQMLETYVRYTGRTGGSPRHGVAAYPLLVS
ncbi:MAG: glycosyltransferase [Tepidisphaerales bacterium]